jgi:hypothetical protein
MPSTSQRHSSGRKEPFMKPEDVSLYEKLWETKIYNERFSGEKIFPLVYCPENPERCLWGMVDWSRWFVSISTDGLIWIDDNNGGKCLTEWDRLDIALIKAILKQEEEYAGL